MVGIAKSSFIIIISRQGAKIGQNECYRAVPRNFRKVSSRRNVSPTRSRRRKVEIFRQESCSRRDLKLSLERRHNDRILCSTMFLFFFLSRQPVQMYTCCIAASVNYWVVDVPTLFFKVPGVYFYKTAQSGLGLVITKLRLVVCFTCAHAHVRGGGGVSTKTQRRWRPHFHYPSNTTYDHFTQCAILSSGLFPLSNTNGHFEISRCRCILAKADLLCVCGIPQWNMSEALS